MRSPLTSVPNLSQKTFWHMNYSQCIKVFPLAANCRLRTVVLADYYLYCYCCFPSACCHSHWDWKVFVLLDGMWGKQVNIFSLIAYTAYAISCRQLLSVATADVTVDVLFTHGFRFWVAHWGCHFNCINLN